MHICRFTHSDRALEPHLRSTLEAALYQFFVAQPGSASAHPGSALAHPRSAAAQPVRAPTPTSDFEGKPVPSGLAELVADIAAGCDYRAYTAGAVGLSEKVAHEAVAWCDQKWAELTDEDPFEDEEQELETFRRESTWTDAGATRKRVRALWANYPEHVETWKTYDRAAGELEEIRSKMRFSAEATGGPNEHTGTTTKTGAAPPAPTAGAAGAEEAGAAGRGTHGAAGAEEDILQLRERTLARRVAATWGRLLAARRRTFERAFLKRALPPFIEKLNRDVPDMARASERVRDFFGDSPGRWDLFQGDWQEVPWEGLEQTAALLEAEPTIMRLAEMLGRSQHVPQEQVDERYEEVIETRSVEVEALGRSEIEGINFSSDVESIIPAERALLADPDTELVFSKRFADTELLSFDYKNARTVEHHHDQIHIRTRKRPVERGPIIGCIDTSGSMSGKPEQVAKALLMALARVAASGGRNCYAIAFSTRIRTFELSDMAGLPQFGEFLLHSFHGGTDLRPALDESLRMLRTHRYERADVLVVSDFQVPKLFDRHLERINTVQRDLGALFHSVTVAPKAPIDPMHIFDFHWHYDLSTGAGGITALT